MINNSIKIGSTIVVDDLQTLETLMKKDSSTASEGRSLTITNKIQYNTEDTEFLLLETDSELYIIQKTVGQDFSVFLMYVPESFQPGSRKDILDNNQHWLFQEPEGDFVPYDLEFTKSFNTYEDENEYEFKEKNPTLVITSNPIVQIHEWEDSIEGNPNPQCICIETGGLTSEGNIIDDGGYVEFYQGCYLSDNDYEVFPIK